MARREELDAKLLDAVERLGRALRLARQKVATEQGLGVLQLQILERLDLRDGRRVGDLAAELDVSQPTVSDAVTTLVGKGVVHRGPDPDDRRASALTLTPEGADLAAAVAADLAPIRTGGHTATDTDTATALEVVLREIARLQDAGVITVNRSCLSCHHFRPADPEGTARCLLLERDLPRVDLRVDCADHVPA